MQKKNWFLAKAIFQLATNPKKKTWAIDRHGSANLSCSTPQGDHFKNNVAF